MNTETTTKTGEGNAPRRRLNLVSEITNAFKKCQTVEAQLERTLRMIEAGNYGEIPSDTVSDLFHAKDKIIEAKETLEGRLP